MAAPPTDATVSPPTAGESLRTFWRWWTAELRAALPARLRAWWDGADQVLAVQIDETGITLSRPANAALQTVATIERSGGDEALRGALAAARAARPLAQLPVLLCVPPQRCLRRVFALPAAATEALRDAVEFELDRRTPFRADQVYFAARVAGAARPGWVDVELTVVPRETVDALLRRAQGLGLAPWGAAATDAIARLGAEAPNLLPPDRRAAVAKGQRMLVWLAGLLLVGAAGAALALPIWQKRAMSIQLMRMVDGSAEQAHATMQVRRALEKLTEQHNALLTRRAELLPAGVALNEIARLLPDDTFLTLFDLTGNRLEIQGESASAGRLVETLEASTAFRNATFKSPLVRVPGVNADRFQITADTRPLPPPAASPPAAVGGAAPADPVGPAPGASPAAAPASTAGPAAAPAPPGKGQ